ncbi:trans-2-enoyl-CoA reductase family protein [Porticoccus sp. W117]|uniref:enoyl-ACP reductase FabV n=1 Tax=Porticoccus sp. W117 TaxID=3054777 RepID=UPI002598045B|nr:enoyl-ACP reductase FabV [Porticoccus sp. W117]MDM3871069.1 trans-2-enoyl-CoA reductase family protein [Porticoccus sp. W117]
MIIKPKIRGFICTNAHPAGCAASVREQIEYVKQQGTIEGAPKKVLVIGASTGYGLASRITAAFGGGADTLGIFFEKPPTEKRTASAGYYNSAAFHEAARAQGLYAESLNGDAFSDELKEQTIAKLKAEMGPVDMVVYSLASPRRTDPKTGVTYSSTLKPVGQSYTTKGLNTDTEVVDEVTVEPASDEEIANTVKVMGGEDWEMWIDALSDAGLLADGCKTVAYTYIGKELTWPIYGKATIGKAKEDLDRASSAIDAKLQTIGGESKVAVLKAVVTQASSAIPVMPLYISLLFKVMKEQGSHEGVIEQIYGLFADQFYTNGERDLDEVGRLRMDLKELDDSIQDKVKELWAQVSTENLRDLSDYAGYNDDFLKLFGFGFDGVDYDADVSPLVEL